MLQIKFNFMEKFISGKAKVVIHNGELQIKQLRRLRMTVDQLEIRLRENNIKQISDVKIATVEANGQLGIQLMRHAEPLTVGDFEKAMGELLGRLQQGQIEQKPSGPNIFDEPLHPSDHSFPPKLQ